MANNIIDKTKNTLNYIGAIQTLVENFPMNLISFSGNEFSTSFDVLSVLFKMLNFNRDELIENITDFLCGGSNKEDLKENGIIDKLETIVKIALETNLSNIINCQTNPIISNYLLDKYYNNNAQEESGSGLDLYLSEVDFANILSKNPLTDEGKTFYFDTDYNANTIYQSKDFNAFLWYIINKSDKSQNEERVWKDKNDKNIIKCTYIDDGISNGDKIKVQICGDTYFKTRKINNNYFNKTIFEFNHDFLHSIKLFEPKVIISEIVEHLLGDTSAQVRIGLSLNERIIQSKINQLIDKVIENSDIEIEDCYFSFSNEEYNELLENSEKKKYNMVDNTNGFLEQNPNSLIQPLTGITTSSTLNEDKIIIQNTLTNIFATPAQDTMTEISLNVNYDWQIELIRTFVYPFVRPLFTPKVIFLLLINKKIMGSLEEITIPDFNKIVDDLLKFIFVVTKSIIIEIKDIIAEWFTEIVIDKLKPLLELYAARLLLESLKAYKDILYQMLENCKFNNNKIIGNIDDVNYADIIPTEIQPNQKIC